MITKLLTTLFVFVLIALVITMIRARPDAERSDRHPRSEGSPFAAWIPWLVGAVAAVSLAWLTGIMLLIAIAAGVVVGASVGMLLRFLQSRREGRLEQQIADTLDLMVSTLRAGGGLMDALRGAASETRAPLRGYLHELIERLRLGERPGRILDDLEDRVPLESFRLFTLALAAHWEGGGSLATSLSNVGRTVRDRVDVTRRVRSQAVETKVSVLGVMNVTYGLAFFMWYSYPDRFELFATSQLGSMFIGLAILLQGIGLFWISQMTRIEV